LFATSVAPFWTSDASPDPSVVRDVPAAAGPPHLATEVHSPLSTIPSRVPRCLPAVRPVGRTNFPELLLPSNGIPRASPVWRGASMSLTGSALRFSQPLSGFLAHPSLRPCFVPKPFLGCLPSEVSPRRNRAPLSGPRAPLSLSTGVLERAPGVQTPPVSPTPTPLGAVAWFPRRSGAPFPRARRHASRLLPIPSCGNRSVPPASPTSKPCSSCESVHAEPGCPGSAADPLLGFRPL
jgi:hypothetical protein